MAKIKKKRCASCGHGVTTLTLRAKAQGQKEARLPYKTVGQLGKGGN